MARTSEPPVRCSFCGKRESQAGRLIAGPGVYICSDCVQACSDLLKGEVDLEEGGVPKMYTTIISGSFFRKNPMWICKKATFC